MLRWVCLLLFLSPPALPAASSGPPRIGCSDGFRVERYVDDVVLDRRWALVRDCDHPERPASLRPVAGEPREKESMIVANRAMVKQKDTVADTYRPVLVHGGEHVRLSGGTGSVRLSLEAVALDPGRQGARIRLRLLRGGATLTGTVTGPAQAALDPPTGLNPGIERKP